MQKYKAVEQPDHLDPSQKDSVTSEHARLSGTDEEFSTSAPTYYQNSDQYASSIPEQREADVPLRRLSSWIRFCVTSAFLMLGVAIIFLSWLWFEHHDTPAWRRLMVSAYAAQAITISGVVIRTALSILGTLTTSMIASIILETRGAPLESIVSISLARYANNGPLTLAAVAPNAIGRRIWTLVTAVLALTLASQFMSTILLYDMGPTTVVDFGKTVANNFAFYTPDHTALKYKSHDYYKQRPSSFASFAEYWEPPINTEDDVDDTGITLRALLPLSSQLERESIRTFRGVARVLDSRVVCLRPQVSNFHVCSDSAGLALCGTISRNSVPSDVWRSQGGLTPGPISTDFICAVHHPDSPMPWSLCKVLKGFGFLPSLHNSSMSPEELFPKARFANDWYGLNMVQNTFSWFIIDISELESVGAYDNQTSWSATEIGVEGAWSTLRVKSSLTERVDNIRATWCAELGAESPVAHMNITASTDMPVKEPAYFVNTTTNDFDTTLVRRQLDATNDGHTRRETLTIAAEDIVKARSEIRRRYNTTFLDTPSRDSAAWLLNSLDTPNYLLMRPARIERGAEFMVDKILAYIFTETIDDTGSAARAIQAFRTTQYRMIYYEHIKAFEPSNTTAVIESFVTVSAPVTKIGYTAAMCIILANCVIFGLTLWQFRRSTRSSVLEGGWSAVAQIASNQDARTILQSSTAMTDDQVKSWIDYGAAPPERPRLGLRGALLSVVVGLRHGVGGLFRQRRTRGDRKSPDIRYHVKDGVLRRKQE